MRDEPRVVELTKDREVKGLEKEVLLVKSVILDLWETGETRDF